MSDWQPIATAPRDGTPFLAYFPKRKVHKVFVCLGEGDFVFGLNVRQVPDIYRKAHGATHWMPLPASPGGAGA